MAANRWIKSPKGYTVTALVAYLVVASIGSQSMNGIMNGIIAVGVSAAADIICCFLERRKRIVPMHRYVITSGRTEPTCKYYFFIILKKLNYLQSLFFT
ncbi:MAG: hypothetical protein JWM44_4114 [Bacilli bacterium]|nr:hypothetical protein [Bacilli bacterium]